MRVICFGDEIGLKILTASVPKNSICGIVVAEGRQSAFSVASSIAKEFSVPYAVQTKEKYGEKYVRFIEWMAKLEPDIGLVCSYSIILTEDVFNLPRKGIFNIHGGLLPEYRGANVLNWVLINGEKETGVTIHRITKVIDAGDIVAMKKIPIAFNDTALTLREKLNITSIKLIRESWDLLNRDPIPASPQDESKAKIWHRRKPEDGIIDWHRPVIEIYNLIRALVSPWPGAFYFDKNGEKVVINYFITFDEVKNLQKKQIGYVIDNE